ncbi:hypothetical protein FPRO05_11275 [Fusarium proliferatum]|uniref:NmrA-like domain-containing protein n=1 Tax=Gibberella intermedia TaxID=948311 RepID=A0A365N9R0_GIBIN|nr:hypothetical protein FPRO05_11275 [Fusarium proliferatum]
MAEIFFSSDIADNVKGKVVVMTGGAQGIGAATVSLLYERGAYVYFGDVDDVKGHQMLDVRNYNEQLHLFKTPYEERGHVDIAISCAAIVEPNGWFGPDQLTLEAVMTEPQPLKNTIDINLTSVVLFCRLAIAFMKADKGQANLKGFSKSIVLLSSIAGITEAAGLFAYSASKHGIIGLVRSLRALASTKYSIRINAVCPWATDTQMIDNVRSIWDKHHLPLNAPNDVAKFITQLATDKTLSGKSVLVAGGRGFDTEEGIDRTMSEWFGPLTEEFWRGQKAFGTYRLVWYFLINMSGTFLVAGATGNTGRGVVTTLSELLKENKTFSDYKILALTRSANGTATQQLARLPNVEVIEQNWVEITADWLREQHVVRAFIASHNEPNQFAEESTFHIAALSAGIEYVVRISTTAANVRPDCPAYYPRTHWAIETLLSSPEFDALKWTSLQPNVFTQFWLGPAASLIKTFRETGKQEPLRLMASEDAAVGPIDSNEVGVFAAHLLASEDIDSHNKAKYVLNGAEDITGRQIVDLVEEYIGTKVEHVVFKDMSFIEHAAAQTQHSKNVILSIKHAPETAWEGKCGVDTTSKEVLQIAAPKKTPAEILKALIQGP